MGMFYYFKKVGNGIEQRIALINVEQSNRSDYVF